MRTSARTVESDNRSTVALACGAGLVTVLLLLAWLAGVPASGADEPIPDLSGTWLLDPDLSEDPMEKMREQRASGGRGMRGGRGGGISGGRPGGMGGGGRSGGFGGGRESQDSSPEEMRQRMDALRASIEQLEITQTAGTVHVVFGDDHEETFTTNNKKSQIETPFGDAEVKAKWKDGGLIVKKQVDKRKTTETYHVTDDGSLLTVVVEMSGDGRMEPTPFKRIYRPAETEDDETGSGT